MDVLHNDFFEARKLDLQSRLKPKRYAHSLGVSRTAEELAYRYQVDAAKARLAGLLHDWDKNYSAEDIQQRARDLDVDVPSHVIDAMPQILHGFTAAVALAQLYPQLPADVLDAIRYHTTGAQDMDDLAKIIYVADVIEPSRDFSGVDTLREAAKSVSLDELYFLVYQSALGDLISQGRYIYPASVEIWNALVEHREKPVA